jgi:hypothetical protein
MARLRGLTLQKLDLLDLTDSGSACVDGRDVFSPHELGERLRILFLGSSISEMNNMG